MIELQQDQLCFSFPAIQDELRHLLDEFVVQTLPAILAEDRSAVARHFLDTEYRYRSAPADYKRKALEIARCLSESAIRTALSQTVVDRAASDLEDAGSLRISFQRTLRIPDDGRDYPLPPGLGCFPLRHIDDYAARLPAPWLDRGGVMMPMYQSEALWLNFSASYPFALKVASGKISAITGASWQEGLGCEPQDYLVLPEQPWLDGYVVEKGIIRQFVAMPLGAGYSVEEQISGRAEFGGLQLQVFPMKAAAYFDTMLRPSLPDTLADLLPRLLPEPPHTERSPLRFCLNAGSALAACDMGLGAGGRMKQEIFEDPHAPDDWDLQQTSRCFVHLCDALLWREITGERPPHTPITALEYKRAKLPWFDFYRDDVAVLDGSKTLAGIKSVVQISDVKDDKAVSGNTSISTGKPIDCGPKQRPGAVREWAPL